MWELDCEESWAPKNCCFWTVVLEETLESPLDCKEIKPVNPQEIENSLESRVFLGRKSMTNLDSILKSKDITLPTNVWLVKAMVFPVVLYGCESWTVKKAEHQKIDGFELWCWRRLLRVPWTARRSNQLIPKEISPEYSLEGMMLKLKLQYFGHLKQRTDSLEKTLILCRQEEKGMTEDETVGCHHWLNGHEFEQALGVGDGQGSLVCCTPWGWEKLDMTDRLNWTGAQINFEKQNKCLLLIVGKHTC